MPAVSLRGVSKVYRMFPRQRDRLKEAVSLGRMQRGHDFWALNDVNLEVEKGTTLGILGRNGAGKSTLLKIVSGVLQPTHGIREIDGRLVALLQLGAGFNPEFSGRENVMLNGLILGLERREMLRRFDEIEAFADIGEFMEQPVKTYSSGMKARLGFAVAVNVEPDILIVDETLSVGDAVFKQIGLQKMRDLRDRGTTILFVSHSSGMIRNFCSEAALLHQGMLLGHGTTSEVLDRYQALLSSAEAQRNAGDSAVQYDVEQEEKEEEGLDGPEKPAFKEDPELERRTARLRHGTGEARVAGVEVLDERGDTADEVDPRSNVTIRAHLEYLEDVGPTTLGITLRNKAGLDVFSTDTQTEKSRIGKRRRGERVTVDFNVSAMLQHGDYSVSAYISYPKQRTLYLDWVDVAAVFKITRPSGRGPIRGLVHLPTGVEIHDSDAGPARKSEQRDEQEQNRSRR